MGFLTRVKKLTDYTYSPTNPTSEDAIRLQIDDASQEVYDNVKNALTSIVLADSGADLVGHNSASLTSKKVGLALEEIQQKLTTERKLSANGDFTGTLNGEAIPASDPGLRQELQDFRTSSVYGPFSTAKERGDNSDIKISESYIYLSDYNHLVVANDWGVAINQALNDAQFKILRVPSGIYETSIKLTMRDTVQMVCDSGTVFKATAAMTYVLEVLVTGYTTQQMCINNLILDGDNIATNGAYFYRISMTSFSAVDGMVARNCLNDGFIFYECQGGAFYNMKALSNGGKGYEITACNNAKFYNIAANANAGDGITIVGVTGVGSGSIHIYGMYAENNSGHGLVLTDVTSEAAIYGGWVEANDLDGVVVNSSQCYVSGLKIIGVGTGTNKAIRITGNGAIFENNLITSTGDVTYRTPVITGESIVGNVFNGTFGIETKTNSSAEGVELLTNGDCEAIGGWTSDAATIAYQSTDFVYSGTYSLKADASISGGNIYQNFLGTFSNIHHITGHVYMTTVPSVRLKINDGLNSLIYTIPNLVANTWTPIDIYIRTKGSSLQLAFQAIGGAGIFYVDECSVKEFMPKSISTKTKNQDSLYEYVLPDIIN